MVLQFFPLWYLQSPQLLGPFGSDKLPSNEEGVVYFFANLKSELCLPLLAYRALF